jgi:hypothetical protein
LARGTVQDEVRRVVYVDQHHECAHDVPVLEPFAVDADLSEQLECGVWHS